MSFWKDLWRFPPPEPRAPLTQDPPLWVQIKVPVLVRTPERAERRENPDARRESDYQEDQRMRLVPCDCDECQHKQDKEHDD